MADDYTPRYVGDQDKPLLCTFTLHDGTVDPLTGASGLTMHFRNRASGAVRTGDGSFSNINGAAGTAQYNWGTNDVATAGSFDFQVSATFSDGTAHWDTRTIDFLAPLP